MFDSLSPEIAMAMTVAYYSFFVMEAIALFIAVFQIILTRRWVMKETRNLDPADYDLLHFTRLLTILQVIFVLFIFVYYPDSMQNARINPEFDPASIIVIYIVLFAILIGIPWFLVIHGYCTQMIITKQKIVYFRPFRFPKSILFNNIRCAKYKPFGGGTGYYHIHTESELIKLNEMLFWPRLSTAKRDLHYYIETYAPKAVWIK